MKSIVIAVFLLIICQLSAQEGNQTYGIFGGFNRNIHITNFQKIPDVPNCCPKFEYGYGNGYHLGLLFEQKLSGLFLLGTRLEYDNFNAVISAIEPTKVIIGNSLSDGEFDHSIETKVSHYQLGLNIGFNPFADFKITAGLFAGKYINADYSQSEKITKPQSSATFLDSLGNDSFRRIRNEYSGSLKGIKALSFGLAFGLSYDFQLNSRRSFKITPEVNYQYFLNDIAENVNWKISSAKMGLALKYSPEIKQVKTELFKRENIIDTIKIESDIIAQNIFRVGKEEVSSLTNQSETEIITTETLIRRDTLFVKKEYKLDGSITAVGVDNTGLEVANPVFKIEEFISNRLDPLLNYIFFENNSAELPARYTTYGNSEANKFEIDSLYRETTLDIYYQILNIIGKRMIENPTANISLVGCNSDLGEETGNIGLSQKRAITVRDYFVNNWSINSNRIKLENKNLRTKVTSPKDESALIAENRRVEINSDNDKILEPIFIEKIDRKANPPIVRFKPFAKSDAGLKVWSINAYQNSDTLQKYAYSGNEKLNINVDWELDKFQKIIPKAPEPIIFSLSLEDIKGNKRLIDNKTLSIEVETIQKKKVERIGNYEIDKYSLILFDFDKSAIEGRNKSIIDFIKARIKPESQIEIRGYTDRTGDEEYNKKLSEKRALATKNGLKRQDAIAVGIGEEQLLYENELPEGRFYSRTVEIIVKTQVGNK